MPLEEGGFIEENRGTGGYRESLVAIALGSLKYLIILKHLPLAPVLGRAWLHQISHVGSTTRIENGVLCVMERDKENSFRLPSATTHQGDKPQVRRSEPREVAIDF